MFKFTKPHILYVLISIFFIVIQISINQYKIKTEINEEIMEKQHKIVNTTNAVDIKDENVVDSECVEKDIEKNEIWQIEIPQISLIANIKEGTTKDILNKYVGHFTTTKRKNGNVGLAAHNRGYEVNYFQDLKLLKEGDLIKYKYNDFEKIYEVEKCRIIKDTDWNFLENTEDNMLTLITCVENQPEYRRCIQAVERREEKY